jgi:ankyrin repeat protein
MWAAASLNYDLIDHLLNAGAKIDAQDSSGWSALHYAASPFHDAAFDSIVACVQRLAEGGADLNIHDRLNRTPLMLAICPHNPALDPRTTRKWGSDLQAKSVKAFLDNGGLVDMSSGSLLVHAIRNGCSLEMIDLVCGHSSALDLINTCGLTLLSLVLLVAGMMPSFRFC